MTTDDRIERARSLYDRAVFAGDTHALAAAEHALNAVEADLALARGRLVHARFLDGGAEDPRELELFERAADLYRTLGDTRGEAEALFWIGAFHQVVRGDDGVAVPALERSRALAAAAGDSLTTSYALRHLGIAAHHAGRLDTARTHLEESVRLRRGLGFHAGVAANLVGLAYITAAEGDRDKALELLDEATSLARSDGAHSVIGWIDEARAQLATGGGPGG
ncbi:tetratricopeptide repeat protein [Nonomuraea sp. NPDC003804]|uniref:tetratricopeptide repeat protein n=1 Tax=Nonomuraea sp. NPDC003804 TaxID=3154547 RepID=UPI0033A2DD23